MDGCRLNTGLTPGPAAATVFSRIQGRPNRQPLSPGMTQVARRVGMNQEAGTEVGPPPRDRLLGRKQDELV